jgi:hypothetical protein
VEGEAGEPIPETSLHLLSHGEVSESPSSPSTASTVGNWRTKKAKEKKPKVDSSTTRHASNPQRFSELVRMAKELAERVRPDTWFVLMRKVEAGRISSEVVDRRTHRADVIVRGFLNTLMEQDLWRYYQLVGLIAWASSSRWAGRELLLSHARGFVPVEPPSVYEFVEFVPRAVARARRLGVNLDEIFLDQSDFEARLA